MDIVFKNRGVISLLDLTTMGDSSKRNDATKIGKFDSGLKYALSILYRNGIKVVIYSGSSKYSLSSKVVSDEITGKSKELLVIIENKDGDTVEHTTAFSPNLGHEWKVWMAIRELYSNCLDEGGYVTFVDEEDDECFELETDQTVIVVHSNSLLYEITENWGNYFLPQGLAPLYSGDGVRVFDNDNGWLRMYKNNILVFEDRNVKSKYIYDYSEASIDEMRLLNDKSAFVSAISSCIGYCKDHGFIRSFISHSDTDYFESNMDFYGCSNSAWVETVNNRYAECNESGIVFATFPGLWKKLIEIPAIDIGVKKVRYNSPSYYWADTKVEVVKHNENVAFDKEMSFDDKIKNICKSNGFEVKHSIVESKISGFTCISDVHKKVLYVSASFSSDNMWEMVKAHFRIDSGDDPDYCFKEYAKLIKR